MNEVSEIGPFVPKAGGGSRVARLSLVTGQSGYDLSLFLDSVPGTDTSGWMLEVAIDPDGAVNGQITARPGYDAIAYFDCRVDQIKVYDNHLAAPVAIIKEAEVPPERVSAIVSEGRLENLIAGLEGREGFANWTVWADELRLMVGELLKSRALLTTLRGVLADVRAHNGNLNDPHGDTSGEDAKAPDGDDYNYLLGLLAPLYALTGEEP
jgi:hypothetical protein